MGFFSKVVSPQGTSIENGTAPNSGFFNKIDFQEVPIRQKEIRIPGAVKFFPGTLTTLAELQKDPLSLGVDIKKTFSAAWEGLRSSLGAGFSRLSDPVDPLVTRKPLSEQFGTGLERVVGLANIALSPVTALFEGAKQVPVFGSVARLVELPLAAIGDVGVLVGSEIVDRLPISDKAKDDIRPGLEEILALAGQLYLGKVAHIGTKKYNELVSRFGETEANTIVNKAVELADKKRIAEDNLLELGKELEGLKPLADVNKAVELKVPETDRGGAVIRKPSKVALSIEEVAIERKLSEGFDGLAGYDPITIKSQAKLVSDLIKSDIELAKNIMNGKEPVPENLRGGSLIVGLEQYAIRNNDATLIKDLAQSPLVSETSRYGQELRLLGERSPQSPVKIIQDVVKARNENVAKDIPKMKETIKTEIKKSASKRPTWEEFIESIKC